MYKKLPSLSIKTLNVYTMRYICQALFFEVDIFLNKRNYKRKKAKIFCCRKCFRNIAQ